MNKKIRDEKNVFKKEITCIGRFTIIRIYDDNNPKMCGIGISRKSDIDKFNSNIAAGIAEGRAFKALSLKQQGKSVNNLFMG